MDKNRLWLGLISFCAGIVFFFNLGNIFPYGSTAPLVEKIVIELVVAMLLFGGLVLMYLSVKSNMQAAKASKTMK